MDLLLHIGVVDKCILKGNGLNGMLTIFKTDIAKSNLHAVGGGGLVILAYLFLLVQAVFVVIVAVVGIVGVVGVVSVVVSVGVLLVAEITLYH
jgi:hypothetical protein